MISIVVADDDPLVRGGIVGLLGLEDDLRVVGEASDGQQALDAAAALRPDVVVMDVRMPGMNGVAATAALCAVEGGPTVLMLTTFDGDDDVHAALLAGASGYLLKRSAPASLALAVRHVAAGDAWLDPSVTARVIAALAAVPTPSPDPSGTLRRLTNREREVLALVAQGLSNGEIAARLVVGVGTVKTHISRILFKTACRDRAQAVSLAYRGGLLRP